MTMLKAYYLFGKTLVPEDIGDAIQKELALLRQYSTREAYAKAAYDLITSRYQSGRINTVLRIFELFSTGVQDLWDRDGFMHCTNQNYLLALFLLKGGLFDESDITLKWTLIGYCSPHQYLRIRVGADQWTNVDCWARQYGVGYGGFAHGFNTTLFRSFAK